MRWYQRFFRRALTEEKLDSELRFHLDQRIAALVAGGMSQEEALRQARLEFGGLDQVKEECRDVGGSHIIETLVQDLRYGLRQFRRNPGFTLVATATLALGIGANTAIFSLIDAVMLKTLPVRRPEQLVLLKWASESRPGTVPWFVHSLSGDSDQDSTGRFTSTAFSYPVFEGIRDGNEEFSNVLAFADTDRLNVGIGGQAGLANGQLVSGDFFSTLGVEGMIGRAITRTDNRAGASPVAEISHSYWVSRFGSDPLVVGKAIRVNGASFTVVGVAPPEFFGVEPGASVDIWLPLHAQALIDPGWTKYAIPGEVSRFKAPDDWWVVIIGRLKSGGRDQQALAALDLVVRQNVASIELPPRAMRSNEMTFLPPRVQLTPAGRGLDSLREQFSKPLAVLMAVVGLVLLIACANVANLLLSRATSRRREIAVRLALGAGRVRLISQMLTESVLLAFSGGALGVALAYWASDILLAFMSGGRNRIVLHVTPNLHVLGFTAGVSMLTGVLCGLAPALQGTGLVLTPDLKEGGGRTLGIASNSRRFGMDLGKVIVISQIAISLLLLIGAGLFVRTLANLEHENLGFDRRNLLLFGLDPTQSGYRGERLVAFYQELQRRIEAIPGVRSASLSRHTFVDGGVSIDGVAIQGYTPQSGASDNGSIAVHVNDVGPDFFETFGTPVEMGRAIGDRDTAAAPKVGVVSLAFARQYLGGTNPIGRRFGFGDQKSSSDIAIVGVVGDVRYGKPRDRMPPTVYVPYVQHSQELDEMNFEVRTAGDPEKWVGPVRRAVRELDANLPMFDVRTQVEQIEEATFQERLFARLSSFFGLLALAVACVGLYGIMSYGVSRRTNEIGVRMALGAERRDVLGLVVWQGLQVTILGVMFGVACAWALTRLLASFLYGVRPADPVTFGMVSLVVIAVSILASYIPARQATKVDPMVALRYE
ncbi:MAG TPA: ABC transporter permease [Terriglobia bacterium]|jgi:predicted permease|nr:ABC transporter permease [Terriglobia bacterium]